MFETLLLHRVTCLLFPAVTSWCSEVQTDTQVYLPGSLSEITLSSCTALLALFSGILRLGCENLCVHPTSCAADDAAEACVWMQACAWICTEAANEEILFQVVLGLTRASGQTYA